jgi:hypothetical protein
MERRFRIRLEELLDDARVRPRLLTGVVDGLESFLEPFVASLESAERRTKAQQYVQGLLSNLDGKDIESIAYLHDRDRQGLQKFIGQSEWSHRPLVTELARQIGAALTVPQVQEMIGQLLNGILKCDSRSRIRRRMERRLKRTEKARLYHWKRRNRLPPRRFNRRSSRRQ